MNQFAVGGITFAGALAYSVWGFLRAYEASRATPKIETFDWARSLVSILPGLAVAFVAGYNMNPSETLDYVALFLSGYAAAQIGVKFGIDSFFR